MKIDFYSHDSMYNEPKPDTITITPYTEQFVSNAKHTIPIHSDIVNMGRINVNPHRMYDSYKKITVKASPTVGETWHYKVPGAGALSTGYVKEVTAHTVVMSGSRWADGSRYVTDEVEFIEKI